MKMAGAQATGVREARSETLFFVPKRKNVQIQRLMQHFGSLAAADVALPDDVRFVLLCFTQRCGSTYLAQLIGSSGEYNVPREALNPETVVRRAAKRNLASFAEYFADLVRSDAKNGRIFIKVTPLHLGMLEEAGILGRIVGRSDFVLIERDDKLAQAISFALARATGQYTSNMQSRKEETELVFQRPAVTRLLTGLVESYKQFDMFFGMNGIVPLHVTYEELVAAPDTVLRSISERIGVPAFTIKAEKIRNSRQTSTINASWRALYLSGEGLSDPAPLHSETPADRSGYLAIGRDMSQSSAAGGSPGPSKHPESHINFKKQDVEPARSGKEAAEKSGYKGATIEFLSVQYEQYLEPATQRFPERFMRELTEVCAAVYGVLLRSGGDAVDLGANHGFHTVRMRQSIGAAPGRVVAVEANAALAAGIKDLVAGDGRVIVLHKAVVETPTESVSFTTSKKYLALGSVVPNYLKDRFPQLYGDAELETHVVEATTIDEIIEGHRLKHLRFLKCDVEGTDFEVIQSSRRLFHSRAGICVEMNRSPLLKQVFETMRQSDYHAYDCFMNRLDATTWLNRKRCPIDRFMLPAELPSATLQQIVDAVARRWEMYRSKRR